MINKKNKLSNKLILKNRVGLEIEMRLKLSNKILLNFLLIIYSLPNLINFLYSPKSQESHGSSQVFEEVQLVRVWWDNYINVTVIDSPSVYYQSASDIITNGEFIFTQKVKSWVVYLRRRRQWCPEPRRQFYHHERIGIRDSYQDSLTESPNSSGKLSNLWIPEREKSAGQKLTEPLKQVKPRKWWEEKTRGWRLRNRERKPLKAARERERDFEW